MNTTLLLLSFLPGEGGSFFSKKDKFLKDSIFIKIVSRIRFKNQRDIPYIPFKKLK